MAYVDDINTRIMPDDPDSSWRLHVISRNPNNNLVTVQLQWRDSEHRNGSEFTLSIDDWIRIFKGPVS